MSEEKFKKIISHAKEYGFIFQSSEIYDGLSAVYDYGQNGVLLKNNIKSYWWKSMINMNDNIVGLDSAIFSHPTTWKASGHLDAFNDPLIDNKDSKKRYRADNLIEDFIEKIQSKLNKEVSKNEKRIGEKFDLNIFLSTNERAKKYNSQINDLKLRLNKALNDDNLTELGEYYANYKPNLLCGPGSDPEIEVVEEVPGNLLENGTFETGDIEPWGGFKNAVITSAAQEPNTGNFLARIEPHDGSIFQLIDVEPGEAYEFSFFHRWKTQPTNTFDAVVRDEAGNKIKFVEYEVPKTDVWTENKIEFTVPEGVTKARLVFYKPQLDPLLPSFFLDDVVVLKK